MQDPQTHILIVSASSSKRCFPLEYNNPYTEKSELILCYFYKDLFMLAGYRLYIKLADAFLYIVAQKAI